MKWLFFRVISRTVGLFTWFKKVIAWWQIHDGVMSDSQPSGKLHRSLFASLLSFALFNKMQSKICHRKEFNRFKIHRMDKIWLELGPFEEFAANFGHPRQGILSSCDHFFFFSITRMKPTVREMAWEKTDAILGSEVFNHKRITARHIRPVIIRR